MYSTPLYIFAHFVLLLNVFMLILGLINARCCVSAFSCSHFAVKCLFIDTFSGQPEGGAQVLLKWLQTKIIF